MKFGSERTIPNVSPFPPFSSISVKYVFSSQPVPNRHNKNRINDIDGWNLATDTIDIQTIELESIPHSVRIDRIIQTSSSLYGLLKQSKEVFLIFSISFVLN